MYLISSLFTSSWLTFCLITFSIVYIIYKYITKSYNLERKFGFPGPKPWPLLGNMVEFFKYGFHQCDVENQRKFGHIYPIYIGQLGMLMVSDEALLRQILVKEAKCFIDRPVLRISSKIMRKNLLQLQGKDWERVRTLVTPTFTSGKLKKMSPMIVASVNEMVLRFQAMADKDVDVKKIFGSLTMDVIAKTMFGIEIDVWNNSSNVFVKHAKKLFKTKLATIVFTITTIIPPLEPMIKYMFPKGIISVKSIEFIQKSIGIAIDSRRQTHEVHHDFLALMLKANVDLDNLTASKDNNHNTKEATPYKGLTDEEMMAQSTVFLLAGYETTASTLTFCTYYLAMNLDVQEELYQELQNNLLDDQEITYEMLSNLNLLEQALNETLRICPPVPRFARLCTKDTNLTTSTGQVIQAKKGMSFAVPVYAIHHDERIWPEPYKFDIHRFDQDVKQSRSGFSFMPFGMGPRNCVGMRFALLEVKLALAQLLKNFKILPCEKTPTTLTFGPSNLTTLKEQVIVRFENR